MTNNYLKTQDQTQPAPTSTITINLRNFNLLCLGNLLGALILLSTPHANAQTGICRPPCVSTIGDTCCDSRPCCPGLTCQYGLCISSGPAPTYQSLNKSLFVWNPSPVDVDQDTPIKGIYTPPGTANPLTVTGTIPTWELLLQNYNQTADTLISFCVNQGFKRIYLFVGSTEWNYDAFYSKNLLPYSAGIAYLIQQATANNIAVFALYYLNDSSDNITSTDLPKLQALVTALLQFNQNNPKAQFAGLIGDIEPTALTMPGAITATYLQVLQTIQTQLKNANSPMQSAAVVTPLMLQATYNPAAGTTLPADPPLLNSILPLVDFPVLLAYSNTTVGVQNIVTPPGNPNLVPNSQNFEIAIETGWNGATAGETFHAEVLSNPAQFTADVLTIANQNPQATIAIHDFAQYFYALNNSIDPYCYKIPSCAHIITSTIDICTLYNNAVAASDSSITSLLSDYAAAECQAAGIKAKLTK